MEDAIVGVLQYASGATGTLEVTTAARPDDFEASISLVGSRGLAQIGGIAVNELQIFTPDADECDKNSEDFQGFEGHGAVYGYGHSAMYRDIVADLSGNKPFPITHADARNTIGLLHGFYKSDEIRDWVWLSDNPDRHAWEEKIQ